MTPSGVQLPNQDAPRAARLRLGILVLLFVQLFVFRELSVGKFDILRQLLVHGHEAGSVLWFFHTLSKVTLFALAALIALNIFERRMLSGPAPATQRVIWGAVANGVCSVVLVALLAMLETDVTRHEFGPALVRHFGLVTSIFLVWQMTAFVLVAPKEIFHRMQLSGLAFVACAALAGLLLSLPHNTSLTYAMRELIDSTTFSWSIAIYEMFGHATPVADLSGSRPVVTVGTFAVRLSPSCSGYQGMQAATLVLGGFVLLEWHKLRLLRAASLVLAAIATIFVFNSVRIAVLMHVGEAISAEVAAEGLHSYLGTVMLFLVSGGAMFALQHPVFRLAQSGRTSDHTKNTGVPFQLAEGIAYLAPLAVYLVISMLLGMINPGFNWSYPLLACAGLVILANRFPLIRPEFVRGMGRKGIVVGIAVYVFWVWMIPVDAGRNVQFAETLFSVPPSVTLAWIALRLIGGSVVVPVLEELAFRAGIPRVLKAVCIPRIGTRAASLIAFAGSSLAFGLMHANILAGALAGACYGVLTLRSGKIGEAIIAHAVTNFLIAITALFTGRWYLW